MFNKPGGCITAVRDSRKKTVMDYFPAELAEKLHPVGRLDIDTEGLLILTDDGMLDPAIMQPKNHIEKEYFIYGIGNLTPDKIAALESGVLIGSETEPTMPAKAELLKKLTVYDIRDHLPLPRRRKYLKNPGGDAFSATLTIRQGKKHQVKLMLHAVGCRVTYLKRLRIGEIVLDEGLMPGEYRPLNETEVEYLRKYKENAV